MEGHFTQGWLPGTRPKHEGTQEARFEACPQGSAVYETLKYGSSFLVRSKAKHGPLIVNPCFSLLLAKSPSLNFEVQPRIRVCTPARDTLICVPAPRSGTFLAYPS